LEGHRESLESLLSDFTALLGAASADHRAANYRPSLYRDGAAPDGARTANCTASHLGHLAQLRHFIRRELDIDEEQSSFETCFFQGHCQSSAMKTKRDASHPITGSDAPGGWNPEGEM
jgi:hypothetical protein